MGPSWAALRAWRQASVWVCSLVKVEVSLLVVCHYFNSSLLLLIRKLLAICCSIWRHGWANSWSVPKQASLRGATSRDSLHWESRLNGFTLPQGVLFVQGLTANHDKAALIVWRQVHSESLPVLACVVVVKDAWSAAWRVESVARLSLLWTVLINFWILFDEAWFDLFLWPKQLA